MQWIIFPTDHQGFLNFSDTPNTLKSMYIDTLTKTKLLILIYILHRVLTKYGYVFRFRHGDRPILRR